MFVFSIFLAIFIALYLVGCYLAYGAVKDDRAQYSRWEIAKYTLLSWLTVAVAAVGRVQ